ncbi:MAG: hypothetical protein KME08_14815 [Aphanothece sp. CMT-3BRIN-NPC111]|jgi:hypothetical protein|nr:hypothetical protein [Aphanothece sp. CMT-3BRIN-NPC111]
MKLNQTESNYSADEADRLAYFQTVFAGFQRAKQNGDLINRFYNIGSYTICLSFAGTGLVSQLTPAFAHLETMPTETPALTVCLWDSASTGIKLPLLVSSLISLVRSRWQEHLDIRGEIKGYNSDRFRTVFQWPATLSVLDLQQNLAIYWVDAAAELPYFERGSPLRTILNWWLENRDRQCVHAGAVGTPTGGVLLAGKGGSGKSTSALACLKSELLYASDDYCLVASDPIPYVYSLYNTAKLKGATDLERFPLLANKFNNLDRLEEEKAMIFLAEHFPEKVVAGFPIKAVLVPRVTGKKDTILQRASAGAALAALAPSTIFQLPSAGKQTFQMLAKLVKAVDCYYLNLGTDIGQIPQIISQLLTQI